MRNSLSDKTNASSSSVRSARVKVVIDGRDEKVVLDLSSQKKSLSSTSNRGFISPKDCPSFGSQKRSKIIRRASTPGSVASTISPISCHTKYHIECFGDKQTPRGISTSSNGSPQRSMPPKLPENWKIVKSQVKENRMHDVKSKKRNSLLPIRKRYIKSHARQRSQPITKESYESIKRMQQDHKLVMRSASGKQDETCSVTHIPGKGRYQHFKNDIMISYSRRNKAFVKTLVKGLKERKIDPWVDWEDIPPAADWKEEIERGIQQAYAVIAVLSPEYLMSEFCHDEIEIAQEHGKLLVPVVYEQVEYQQVWPDLARVNWIFMRKDDNFNEGMEKLIDALHLDFDYVQRHAELCRKALEYKKNPSPDLVLRGDALRRAKKFLVEGATKHPSPIPEQIDYIIASKARR
eukprot:CAMPEP_0167759698 /NCGR_PEP_ID=MMETSP0110_2-20121227/11167_1 /TAXON_ID=629695 /ORGANISM="Gymnochlora sp., Strain CCMP2014" /LENGTH=405 /DNA_ID=CAMNT_0007646111 /DNA_START=51 /DNA_END=1265 /DNA_ORIENTATION=-